MSWELRCGDVVPDCQGTIRADTREEVLSQAAAHAADAHGLTAIDAGTARALAGAMRER